MFRLLKLFPGVLAVLVLSQSADAQNPAKGKPSPTPTKIEVTSVVNDHDEAFNDYKFRSDGAPYTNTGGVTSTVGTGGGEDWSLHLFSQSLRKIRLTLTPADGSTPPAPDGYYWDKVEIYSWCYDGGNRVGYLSITTENDHCIFSFDFASGSTPYKMAMGQFASPVSSGWAKVTCTATSNGQCRSWTLTPNFQENYPTIANLYKFGKRSSLEFLGQYYLTFEIDITNP